MEDAGCSLYINYMSSIGTVLVHTRFKTDLNIDGLQLTHYYTYPMTPRGKSWACY